MSASQRNWLSASEIARLSNLSERHVRRSKHFDCWRIEYPGKHRQRKHHRFFDDHDLRDFCEALREMNSLPADPRISRWERYAGKNGEALRTFKDRLERAHDLKEKAAVLADMNNTQELGQEIVDALNRYISGKDPNRRRTYEQQIRKVGIKWLAMITDGKLPMSTDEMHQELLERQAAADDQRKAARKTPTERRDPFSRGGERDDFA